MSLSTFNSKRSWLQLFTLSALLFTSYSLLLEHDQFRYGGGVGSSDWENCKIRAERYLYDIKNPRIVIVGSSLAQRIDTNYLSTDFFSLATNCLRGIVGLEIVHQAEHTPKIIIIESNIVVNPTFSKILDEIFHPFHFHLKHYFKSMRTEYKPSNVFRFGLKKILGYKEPSDWTVPTRIDNENGIPKKSQKSNLDISIKKISPEIAKKFEQITKRQETQGIESGNRKYKDNRLRLKQIVQNLESRNAKVVFLEMPMKTRNATTGASFVESTFPNHQIIKGYLHASKFEYSDGRHLSFREKS